MRTTSRVLLGAAVAAGVGGSAVAGLRRATRPLPPAPLPGQVRDIDDERIHVVDHGEGEAVVFIHGFAGSLFTWRYVMEALMPARRVVALDLPGFGFSDRSLALDYSRGAHARRVTRLMDELGIERATVVGHSMGGAVAQHLAVMEPARVERLVLLSAVDASERAPWHDPRRFNPSLLRVIDFGLRFPALVRFASRRTVLDIVADPAYVTQEIIDGYVRPILVPGTAAAVGRMIEDTRNEAPADLSKILAPTLVVSGEFDPSVPVAVGEGLARKIRGARHVVIPGTGHLAAEERPEAFIEELVAFMRAAVPAINAGQPPG